MGAAGCEGSSKTAQREKCTKMTQINLMTCFMALLYDVPVDFINAGKGNIRHLSLNFF